MEQNTALAAYEKQKIQRLLIGIFFDLLGILSMFGVLTEGVDLAWAPIAAATFFGMYGGLTGLIGGSVVFIEELLPFTDPFPTFTIAWLWVYQINGKKNKAKFMNKQPAATDKGIIDITGLQDSPKTTA